MPKRQTYQRQPPGPNPIWQEDRHSDSIFLKRECWTEDSTTGDRIARAGSVIAIIDGGLDVSGITVSQPYGVPWSPTAAYGTGSDTADGILRADVDLAFHHQQVTIVTSGIVLEKYCKVPGGTVGDIPAAVKTDLSNIEWRG